MDQKPDGVCRPLSIFEKCQFAIIGGVSIGFAVMFLIDYLV